MIKIDKVKWHKSCNLCGKTLKQLAVDYGGGGIYYCEVLIKHLNSDHNIEYEDYFINQIGLTPPICKCGICGKQVKIIKWAGNFYFREYACGRNEGVLRWSEKAKISRKGSGNPRYKKEPWNKGKTQHNDPIVKRMVEKARGRQFSDKVKKNMSLAAQKRTIHGHTGHKHSEETKEYLRQNTLRMIKEGKYKQTQTKPHIEFSKFLKELHIEYEEEKIIGAWSFDFYITNNNIAIEVDGDYFHSNPIRYPDGPKTSTQKINKYRDLKKNQFCKDNNITLVRIWENDILKNKEDVICLLKKLFLLNT